MLQIDILSSSLLEEKPWSFKVISINLEHVCKNKSQVSKNRYIKFNGYEQTFLLAPPT